ncbi:MAG: substrate-binding domain-containing protein, partial [bacterium]
ERGEVDLLLVHSPEAEEKFMSAGYGIRRRAVMENDFLLVGPAEDPAKIRGTKEAINAFQKISTASSLFISRGDSSGTHAKELSIWKAAKINPDGQRWYQQTGLGMGQTLTIAAEKRGYTLTDQGTYMALRKNLNLEVFLARHTALRNYYHVIEINPKRWPKVNNKGAQVLADFLVGKEAQEIIRTFGVSQFGSPLFFPIANQR